MKDVAYLVVSKSGVRRLTKKQAALARDEIAVRMCVTIPDECFRPLSIDVDVEVPEEMIIRADVEPEAEPAADPA